MHPEKPPPGVFDFILPFEIACSSCSAILYTGFDLKTAKDVIRTSDYKCKSCGRALSPTDFSIDVLKA